MTFAMFASGALAVGLAVIALLQIVAYLDNSKTERPVPQEDTAE